MKVLLVGAYPPPYGGIQVHLVHLEKYLQNKGHRSFVINLGKNKTLWSSTIASPRNSLSTALQLIKRRSYICHLHFGGLLHVRLLLLALFCGLFFHKRCAITIHSGGLSVWGVPQSPLKRLFLRISFCLCNTVICVNPEIGNFFRQLGVKCENIKILSAFAFEKTLTNDPFPERIAHFMKDRQPLLCSIGLLEAEYDLELLLRVFGRFTQTNPRAGLIIIGSGTLLRALEDLIVELQLQDEVLLAGDLSHTHTLKILSSSNIYIRASRYDGDCFSLKEALHLGVPAIASNTGMRPEGTILFPIGDEEALMDRIVTTASTLPRQGKIAQDDSVNLAEIEKILLKLSLN